MLNFLIILSGVTCVLVKRGMTHTVLQSGLAQFAAKHKWKYS